jgi:ABC-type nickel/cobalt efflux system permease component RcnA/ABC-type uncharacterized transport system substrate-binding protein
MGRMLRAIASLVLAAIVLSGAMPAQAHPHVWVTMRTTIVYGPGGVATAIRHAWRFDDLFSSFAIQGLDTNKDGIYSRQELSALATVNVNSLKEFDFFTHVKTDGGRAVAFKPPVDYWLDHDGKAVTLHFTLPFVKPLPADQPLSIAIYDPTYFVDFAFAEGEAVDLLDAPAGCRADLHRPGSETPATAGGQKLTEQFFSTLTAKSSFGAQFANTIDVRCGADLLAFAAPSPAAIPEAATPAQELAPLFRKVPTTVVMLRSGMESVADTVAGPQPAKADTSHEAPRVRSRVEQAQRIAAANPLGQTPASTYVLASAGEGRPLGAFGLLRPDGQAGALSFGMFRWIAERQAAFYQAMAHALNDVRHSSSALLLLAALGFAYGVFHAVGPGHGKAVIASYLVASGDTLKRGVALSFAAAAGQAATAILIVGILALVLGATGRAFGIAAYWMEAASYAVVAGLGAVLVLRKGAGFVRVLRGDDAAADHACDQSCAVRHAPDPALLAGPFDWRRAGTTAAAVALRPCSGALIVLVFALAQGMLWAGVAATFAMAIGAAVTVAAIASLAVGAKGLALRMATIAPGPVGIGALRGFEALAGLTILVLGLGLLGGLLANGIPAAG